jgi:hypothetical protein
MVLYQLFSQESVAVGKGIQKRVMCLCLAQVYESAHKSYQLDL